MFKRGVGPLFIARPNRHDSAVEPLLSKGTYINLCEENNVSLLYVAFRNGHDSTVFL